MTTQRATLIPSKEVDASETTQYTSTGVTTTIWNCTVTNKTGSAATITIRIVPSGGSAGATNTIISARSIAAGECYPCPELVGKVLGDGQFISTLAGTANALVINAGGVIETV